MMVRVDKILLGGEALAHAENESVLLHNGIPGDQLKVSGLKKRRGMPRAKLENILQASPLRVDAPCQHAAVCGACALQFLAKQAHASLKSQWVLDAFKPYVLPQTRWQPITTVATLEQRRRIRFWHDRGHLGLRQKASHNVIPLQQCLVCVPRIESLRQFLQNKLPVHVESVQFCHLSDGTHVILESQHACPEKIEIHWPDDVQPWWRDSQGTRAMSKKVMPLHDVVHGLNLRVGPDDFIQNDALGNHALLTQLKSWCADARFVVDLFSGIGNLSLPLAQNARVLGAELHVASVRAANANAKRLHLNAQYHSFNLFQSFPFQDFAGADVLILDPPRRGAKEICKQLGMLMPKKIIMVSCDIASGARDAKAMQQAGFQLKELKALDLFPYAGHVEALSLWERI